MIKRHINIIKHTIEKYYYFINDYNLFFNYLIFLNSKLNCEIYSKYPNPFKNSTIISIDNRLISIKDKHFFTEINLTDKQYPIITFTFYIDDRKYQIRYRLSKSNYNLTINLIPKEFNRIKYQFIEKLKLTDKPIFDPDFLPF